MAVRKDDDERREENDYVKVETKASREREERSSIPRR